MQTFFAAVKALSRKEVHYGAYATSEQVCGCLLLIIDFGVGQSIAKVPMFIPFHSKLVKLLFL